MVSGDGPKGGNHAKNAADEHDCDCVTNDALEGALIQAFRDQTAAIRDELKTLGVTLGSAVADLRAEARSTRLWVVGLVALAISVVGGVVGVSVAIDGPIGLTTNGSP